MTEGDQGEYRYRYYLELHYPDDGWWHRVLALDEGQGKRLLAALTRTNTPGIRVAAERQGE